MTESNHLLVQGHSIAYLDEGSGPPVILVHGIPTSNRLWRNIIPRLARSHRVLAPDLLNYGRSDKPADANVSIAAQAEMLVGFMDALGIPRAHVLAHDIGGGIGQILAVRHPERVRKLALGNTVCFDSWPIPEFQPLQKEGAEEQTSVTDLVEMMREFLPQGVHQKDSVPAEVYEMMIEPWNSEEGKRAFFRNLRRLNPEYTQAIAGELKHLDHETLIYWGRHDAFQKPHFGERLAQTLPNARLEWLEAGHWTMEERPEEVAELLAGFVESTG